jgi:UDP-glucose 4-epimerase
MASKIVLITGVNDYWGSRLARRLLNESGMRIIGVDAEPPQNGIKGVDFVQADVRNPALTELFELEQVHTVCHLKFINSIKPSDAISDLNLRGTQNIMEACAAAGVKKVLLKSSLSVYGAHPNNPALLTETDSLRGSPRYGYTRHLVDIEKFCNVFRRERPEFSLTTLRFASIIGSTADTPMSRLLNHRWAPALLGFDPTLQVLHEDDALAALAHGVLYDRPGAFNIAADGPLPLSRVLALAGTIPLPILHPMAYWGLKLLGNSGADLDEYAPIEPDYLRYSWVGDVSKMRDQFGFVPGYTAEDALREFAVQCGRRRPRSPSEALTEDEERLRATIERRRRAKEQDLTIAAKEEENE